MEAVTAKLARPVHTALGVVRRHAGRAYGFALSATSAGSTCWPERHHRFLVKQCTFLLRQLHAVEAPCTANGVHPVVVCAAVPVGQVKQASLQVPHPPSASVRLAKVSHLLVQYAQCGKFLWRVFTGDK